jgi:hypothetical protein
MEAYLLKLIKENYNFKNGKYGILLKLKRKLYVSSILILKEK